MNPSHAPSLFSYPVQFAIQGCQIGTLETDTNKIAHFCRDEQAWFLTCFPRLQLFRSRIKTSLLFQKCFSFNVFPAWQSKPPQLAFVSGQFLTALLKRGCATQKFPSRPPQLTASSFSGFQRRRRKVSLRDKMTFMSLWEAFGGPEGPSRVRGGRRGAPFSRFAASEPCLCRKVRSQTLPRPVSHAALVFLPLFQPL